MPPSCFGAATLLLTGCRRVLVPLWTSIALALSWCAGLQAYTVASTVSPEITARPIRVVLWVRDNVSAADEARTVSAIEAGLRMWEEVATSHLRFDPVTLRSATRPPTAPEELLVIVAYLADLTVGGASLPSAGRPGTWFGARADFPGPGLASVAAHESGHALGLLHSTLSSRTFTDGIPVMHWATAGVSGLAPDDVAAVSVAYPNPDRPLGTVTGTLTGRLVSASTGLAIDGVNVVAVDAATGAARVGVLSAAQGGAGRFELRGVPPGDLELHVLDGRSFAGTGFVLAPGRIQADAFETIRQTLPPLGAGETLDLGDLALAIEPLSVDRIGHDAEPRADDLDARAGELPDALLGAPYLAYARVRGGVRPLRLEAASLPPGLSAYLFTGRRRSADPHGVWQLAVHGVPRQAGLHALSLAVVDDHGSTGDLDLTLRVEDRCTSRGGDADGDGRCDDGDDNCPSHPNPSQRDADADGIGDACSAGGVARRVDFEADGEGVPFPESVPALRIDIDEYLSLGLRISPILAPPLGELSDTLSLYRGAGEGLYVDLAALGCCPTLLELVFDPPARELGFEFWTPSAPVRVRAFDAYGALLSDEEVERGLGRVSLGAEGAIARVRAEVAGQVLRIDGIEWTPSPCGGLLDEDGDGVCAPVDSCPAHPNPAQADADGDGRGDGCDPRCSDGLDNDGDGRVDWDGGPGRTDPDPDCLGAPWRDEQRSSRCGMGLEPALLLALVAALRRARAGLARCGRALRDLCVVGSAS